MYYIGLIVLVNIRFQSKLMVFLVKTNCCWPTHFGNKQYLRDTSECVDGIATFMGKESLENGVYLVVLPKKNYFEILISKEEDQTQYVFHTDTLLNPNTMKTEGSLENKLFFEFNSFAIIQGKNALQ